MFLKGYYGWGRFLICPFFIYSLLLALKTQSAFFEIIEFAARSPAFGARSSEFAARSPEFGAFCSEFAARSPEVAARSSEIGAFCSEVGARSPEFGARSSKFGARSSKILRVNFTKNRIVENEGVLYSSDNEFLV